MKKVILYLFTIMLIVIPISVKANILCNDGTTSPSCQDCHRGCCSRHGGCASSNSSRDETSDKKQDLSKKNYYQNIYDENNNNDSYDENINDNFNEENTRIYSNDSIKEDNNDKDDDSSDSGLIGLLVIWGASATILGIKSSKKK